MIIGLVGLAQSGKDTTAEILVRRGNFQQISFAGPLKQISYDIDPLITADKHLAELVDEFGWDHVKVNYPECRRFLQRIGTEGMRKNIHNNFWVNLALTKMQEDTSVNYVISDMRFLNEYNQIKNAYPNAFEAWRIVRDGLAVMNHASETEMSTIPVDRVIDNNGTIRELEKTVSGVAESLGL